MIMDKTPQEETDHMDITEHQQTWSGFVKLTVWGILGVGLTLILMALFLV